MGIVANVVVNDGLATPVAHTFVPLGPDSQGVWWYEDQSPTTTVAFKRLSMSLVRPPIAKPQDNPNQRFNRITVKFYDPVADNVTNSTVSGVLPAPSLAYVSTGEIVIRVPERSTLQNRKDMRAYLANIFANANLIDMVDNLRNTY